MGNVSLLQCRWDEFNPIIQQRLRRKLSGCLWSNERHFVRSIMKVLQNSENMDSNTCLRCQRWLFPLCCREVKLLWWILSRLGSEDLPSVLQILNCLVRQSKYEHFLIFWQAPGAILPLVAAINKYEIHRYQQSMLRSNGSWKNRELFFVIVIKCQPPSYQILLTAPEQLNNSVYRRSFKRKRRSYFMKNQDV